MNDWSACQNICSSLLAKDPNNELALLMSADLSFRRCDFIAAYNLFNKLLSQKPTYWLALARTIEVKRRMASLKDVVSHLESAAAVNRSDPGLAYCTGMLCLRSYVVSTGGFQTNLGFLHFVKYGKVKANLFFALFWNLKTLRETESKSNWVLSKTYVESTKSFGDC